MSDFSNGIIRVSFESKNFGPKSVRMDKKISQTVDLKKLFRFT